MSNFQVGNTIPVQVVRLTRTDLQTYAQASGDHNPIHLDDEVASAVGLPGVIAHGMLTMGHAARVVADFAGGAQNLRAFSVRFTRPVVVPALTAEIPFAEIQISGEVSGVDAESGEATIAVTVTFNGQTVLGRAQARIAPQR